MTKCIGCGTTLQDKDKLKRGYTPSLKNKYCERCFKTINYNTFVDVDVIDNKSIINNINKLNKYTIFITDLINLNKNIINIYNSINNSKALVINKCDLIPNNMVLNHLKDNIRNSYNIKEDIFFISVKNDLYINNIVNIFKNNNEVIFCGETSSGKSSLINLLTDKKLTISKYNNTTLDFIKINYLDYIIYDSPGFLINKVKLPLDNIEVKLITLKEDYVYKIGNVFIKGKGNLTIFINSNYNITSKKEELNNYKEIEVDGFSDIVIEGIAFIYVKNKSKLLISGDIEIRKSFIGR